MAADISRHTNAMMCLHATLIRGCSTLKTKRIAGKTEQTNDANNCNATSSSKTYIKIGTGRALRPLITPNDTMLPLWSEFSDALSSLPTQPKDSGVVHLLIAHVQLTDEILEILSSALHKAPLYRLAMMNVGLGSDGVKLLRSVVEENTHLCNFSLRKNEIRDQSDALSLVEAVGNHPGIHICSLDECGIGGDQLPVVPEIVHTLFRLEAVGLGGNGIESTGAQIICECLAINPSINFLDLDDNLFNDDDALLFATSLNSNTNLVDLSLRGNNFTSAGINTLYRSIFDDESLSKISDSNHTCELKLFDDGEPIPAGIDGEVLLTNDKHFEPGELPDSARELFMMDADTDKGKAVTSLQVDGRKKMKMLHALVGGGTNEGAVNMKYLNDTPIELLPEVLMFFQDASKYAGTEEINFDMLFQLVRSRPEWAWISSVSNRGSKECLPLKG